MKQASVFDIFLASPSDLEVERTMADEVVTAVNKSVAAPLGWHINLHKWEDAQPGFGRPQALINPKVDECDLFVGLIWERWGQSSGKYSSGFEEEYERARARRKSGDVPEIWLFFKEVDAGKLKDPGEQLRKVIEFRKSQTDLREVFYKEFGNPEDWKFKFNTYLAGHIVKLARPVQTGPQQPAPAAVDSGSPGSSDLDSPQGDDQDEIPEQLKAVSSLLAETLQAHATGFFGANDNQLQEFDVARLYLLSATLMSVRYTREVLGTHDVNLLYKFRERLDATTIEIWELLRAIVEDSGDVRPGWCWFTWPEDASVSKVLFMLASRDSSEDVRRRALDLLASARIEISSDLWPSLPLLDSSLQVRQSAFNYLVVQADETAIPLLEQMARDNDGALRSEIENARLRLLMRLAPQEAFSEIVTRDEYVSADERRVLMARIAEVEERALLNGTKSSWEDIRQLSLEELIRRGNLPAGFAETFTRDPSLSVRALAFHHLAAQGVLPDPAAVRNALKNSDETSNRLASLAALGRRKAVLSPDLDSILVTFYRTQNTETLLKEVDWFSLDGHLAYRALALDRFDSFSNVLRSDLANGFGRIKDESLKRIEIEEENGPELARKVAARFQELDEFIRSQFTKAALIGLARNAQDQDAELVRPHLTQEDSSLRELAVTVISNIGNSEDADALLRIAKEAYGDVKEKAAAGALKLASDPLKIAQDLTLSNASEVVRVAFDWLFIQDSPEVKKIFEDLLQGENSTNRVRALYYFSKRLKPAELEEMMDQYIKKSTYYYNVVTWLDRLLYAPAPLRDMFARDLEAEATRSG